MLVTFLFALLSILDSVLRTLPEFEDNAAFDFIEIVSISWFCLELVLRFIVCPSKLAYFKSFITITDLLSVVPFFIYLILQDFDTVEKIKDISRIFRCFAFINITRFFSSMRLLGQTIVNSAKEISFYLVYLSIGVLIFSSFVYYVESDVENTAFTSIPAAFW